MSAPRGCSAFLGAVVLTGAMAALYALAVRPWQLRWGATAAESQDELPGDGIIPRADLVSTRAIGIDASPDHVWPWIAQLGQGRGGFYSYDCLENLAGCDIHSADQIVSRWQDVEEGDEVNLAPGMALVVAGVEPGRSLVLRGGVPMGPSDPPYDFTWSFAVRESASGGSRLLVRERYAYNKAWTAILVEPVEAISFLMTQKMLRGIRRRAEAAPA